MSTLLFRLRGVPEDEAEEVRELFDANRIDYYETPPGNWGISMPAIWLRDDSQLAAARSLLEEYQRARQASARAEYLRLKQQGRHRTVFDALKDDPLRFVFSLALVGGVLYLSAKLILGLVK